MEDLVNYVNFIYTDIFDEILESDFPDTCYVWGYTSHKPSGSIGTCIDNIDAKKYPLINDYKLWLNFFCDYVGYDVSIYYPKNPIINNEIKVIFQGAFINGFVSWIHGQLGLFKNIILPLLVLEKNHTTSPACKTCKSALYKDENNKNFCPICSPPF